MATEPAAAASAGPPDSLQRLLIEAMARGGQGFSSLKDVLASVPMAPDQRSLVEMLMAAEQQGEAPDADADAPPAADRPDPEVDELKRELADLREVNDTLAAALGACRACWGGDRGCPDCGGRGGAGSAPPDPALFRELVIPAVRRARSLDRAVRPAFRRPRVDGSGQWRHSNE